MENPPKGAVKYTGEVPILHKFSGLRPTVKTHFLCDLCDSVVNADNFMLSLTKILGTPSSLIISRLNSLTLPFHG
jgi:hypothetical protein